MTKSNVGIVRWSAVRLGGTLAACCCFVGIMYAACAFDAKTWPSLTGEGLSEWMVASIFIGGGAPFFFLYLVLREILKRRGFDLETIENDNLKPDPIGAWLVKSLITYGALFPILNCGMVCVVIVFHIPLKDWWETLSPGLLLTAVIVGIVLPCNLINQMRKLSRERKTR